MECSTIQSISVQTQTRYVDGTPTSEVTPVTIRHIRPPHQGHTGQHHGHEWMTQILLVLCRSTTHSWDKASSDSDLETPRSRSWVWSKGKVIQSAQYHISSLPFHFTSIWPAISEVELCRNLTLKQPRSRSWVRSKVKVTYCTQYPVTYLYPVSNQCTSFLFHINRTNHSCDMAKIVFELELTHPKFLMKICQNNSFQQNFSTI